VATNIFTTLFLRGGGAAGYLSYEVPSGYRAVVKSADVANVDTAVHEAFLDIAGTVIAIENIPGISSFHWEGTAVANAGETIYLYFSHADLAGQVSGFLFIL
jgi:hypothetical protein